MADVDSGRFADCPRCGALYVHGRGSERCTVCGAPRPAEPLASVGLGASREQARPAAARLADGGGMVPPKVLVGAVATWAVVIAAIVWAAT
ncbi:MAG: hypothetical protein EP329_03740 [Deltaproteobacteria bacterium]|nr:MAG: hypothetical protein EP329_03740 [Deltaproteobacteria bacterium]